MIRKVLSIVLVLGFSVAISGCAEDEIKTTRKSESRTESEPTDTSPGEMIVE